MYKVMVQATFVFIMMICLTVSPSMARNYTSEECQQFVNFVNKDLPEQVDSVTILKNSTCLVIGSKSEFTYNYMVDTSKIGITSIPSEMEKHTINGFCSNPDSRVFFRGLTKVKKDYYDLKTGKFFGRIEITKSDC